MQLLAQQLFKGRRVPCRSPELQLRIAGRAHLQERIVAAIVQGEPRNRLGVAAVEALREPENRGQRADRAPPLAPHVGVFLVLLGRRCAAMIARDERDRLDFAGIESAQVAVLDQVVRMLVVTLVGNVDADVVQQCRVVEPLALAIGEAVDGPRLIEEMKREPRDLTGMFRPVVAPLRELDHAPATDVRIAVRLRDLLPMLGDVFEDQSFTKREIAQRDLVRAEPFDDGFEQQRTGRGQVGAARIEAGDPQPLFERQRAEPFAQAAKLFGRDPPVAQRLVRRAPVLGRDHGAEAEDRARRADDLVEPGPRDLVEVLAGFLVDVLEDLALVARLRRIALHEAFSEADDAELEAASQFDGWTGAPGDLDAAAADVDDDGDLAGDADAVNGCLMNEPRLLGSRDHARANPGSREDGFQELAAVLGLARRAGGDGDDFIDAVRLREPRELRQHLERRVHGLGGEPATVEAAGAEPHHLLLAIDHFEREVGPHAHHNYVERVGADVDGGNAHLSSRECAQMSRRGFDIIGKARPFYIMPGSISRDELLRSRLSRFTRFLHGLAKGNAPAVHRSRIASRRLREVIPVLQLDARSAAVLSRRLRKVTRRLGGVREFDTLLQLLEELHESGRYDRESLSRVTAHVIERQGVARKRRAVKLPIAELERLSSKLSKIADELAAGEKKRRPRSAGRGWRWAIDARVSRRGAALKTAMAGAGALYLTDRLHVVRVAVKKFRYALELRSEAAGESTRTPDLKLLKDCQHVLGRLRDRQVLIDETRQIQASLMPPDLGAWRRLDTLTTAIENECRRLHGRFLREVPALTTLCDRTARDRRPASEPGRTWRPASAGPGPTRRAV